MKAMEKKAKAEELLVELEKNEIRQEPDTDKEGITEEERHMLRKVGLRMKAFLLTGKLFHHLLGLLFQRSLFHIFFLNHELISIFLNFSDSVLSSISSLNTGAWLQLRSYITFLLLSGRRGIFDGTVENMHLHWKYRELVKIISKQKSFEAAYQEAQLLEAESGGILVAVERVSKGYAIIVYRGKNYERPSCLRPKTLLTKKQALKRHLETQRREVNLHPI